MAQSEAEVTAALFQRDPPSDAADAVASREIDPFQAWNRVNKAIVRDLPRNLRKAEAARRRIAKLR